MSDCCTPKGYRTIFSEKSARSEAKRYRRRGLDRLSRRVADVVRRSGVEGRSVLEVGGGVGAIELELLRAGAARATNVELTPTYEEAAGELLREAGMGDRVERRMGDFVQAEADVAPADFVILNRVICCYPDMPGLAAAAARRATGTLVLSFPNDRWTTRLGLAVMNLGLRVFRVQFQIFLHRPRLVLEEVERQGFRTRITQRGLFWQLTALDRIA